MGSLPGNTKRETLGAGWGGLFVGNSVDQKNSIDEGLYTPIINFVPANNAKQTCITVSYVLLKDFLKRI